MAERPGENVVIWYSCQSLTFENARYRSLSYS
jgi:hypothetical protein